MNTEIRNRKKIEFRLPTVKPIQNDKYPFLVQWLAPRNDIIKDRNNGYDQQYMNQTPDSFQNSDSDYAQ